VKKVSMFVRLYGTCFLEYNEDLYLQFQVGVVGGKLV